MGRQERYQHFSDKAGKIIYHSQHRIEKNNGTEATSFYQPRRHSMPRQSTFSNQGYFLYFQLNQKSDQSFFRRSFAMTSTEIHRLGQDHHFHLPTHPKYLPHFLLRYPIFVDPFKNQRSS